MARIHKEPVPLEEVDAVMTIYAVTTKAGTVIRLEKEEYREEERFTIYVNDKKQVVWYYTEKGGKQKVDHLARFVYE